MKKQISKCVHAKNSLAMLFVLLSVSQFSTPAISAMPLNEEQTEVKDSTSLPRTDENKFIQTEVQPEYPGGESALMTFIMKNLHYPAECAEKGIEGRVTLSFVIEEDGTVTDIQEMRSPHPLLTEEAARIIKGMPKWKPGMKDGKPVRVKYVLPITFKGGKASKNKKN